MDQIDKSENPIMRADELRQMLHIGRNTLYSWVEHNLIPCKKVGRVLLFSRTDIMKWISNQGEGGANERTHSQ